MARHILALDQGTTSTRAILFDPEGDVVASAQRELQQLFPADGWVEHDPEHIWADSVAVCREALERAGLGAHEVAALGITNQRETAILWERASGRPVHNAIVWQRPGAARRARRPPGGARAGVVGGGGGAGGGAPPPPPPGGLCCSTPTSRPP